MIILNSPQTSVFGVIKYLINAILARKAQKSMKNDLTALVTRYGPDAQRFMFVCLLQGLDVNNRKQPNSTRTTFIFNLLSQFAPKESFLHYFGHVIKQCCQKGQYFDYVVGLSRLTKLPNPIQVLIGLSMVLCSDPIVSKDGLYYLKNKLSQHVQQSKSYCFPQRAIQELFNLRQRQDFGSLDNQYKFILQNNQFESNLMKPEQFLFKDKNKITNQYIVGLGQADFSSEIFLNISTPRKPNLLIQFGPKVTQSVESLRFAFNDQPLTEEQILRCFVMMAQSQNLRFESLPFEFFKNYGKVLKQQIFQDGQETCSWNIDVFIDYCLKRNQGIRWSHLLKHLDQPQILVSKSQNLSILIQFIKKAKRAAVKFVVDLNILLDRWNNPKTQIDLICKYLSLRDKQLLHISFQKRPAKLQSLPGMKVSQVGFPLQLFSYIDFVSALFKISDSNAYFKVKQIFQQNLSRIPQILILTILSVPQENAKPLMDELLPCLLQSVINNYINHQKLLQLIWDCNSQIIVNTICQIVKSESKKQSPIMSLNKVLDITQVLKDSLIVFVYCNDYKFSAALAILAGKRQFLHFDKWIKERLKQAPNQFMQVLLHYIQQNFFLPLQKTLQRPSRAQIDIVLQKSQLTKDLITVIFLSALQLNPSKLNKKNTEKLKTLYREMCDIFPQLSQNPVSEQIDNSANSFFQRIYKGEKGLEEAIAQMASLKSSSKPQEKQLFAGMITLLFSEMRFHQSYPQKELLITAKIFSKIILNDLIDKKLVIVVLQFIRDSLKQINKKHDFSVVVLGDIMPKLLLQRQMMEEILQNEIFVKKYPALFQKIVKLFSEKGVQLQLSKSIINIIQAMNKEMTEQSRVNPSAQDIFSVPLPLPDVDILADLDKTLKYDIPSTFKQKYLHCLTQAQNGNIQCVNTIKNVQGDICQWLAYITFFRKAVKASNNKTLQVLVDIIDKTKNKDYQKKIIKISYATLKKYLGLPGKSINDRNLKNFKNAGYFLGKLTLARNKPILINRLNLKTILINSIQGKARMENNVQVIMRILLGSKNSLVFKQENPWMAPILTIIKDLQNKSVGQFRTQIHQFLKQLGIKISTAPQFPLQPGKSNQPLTIKDLLNHVKINQEQLKEFLHMGLDLKNIVAMAVEAAIQQIIPPVIARSVTIALVTTKQLTLKDFAMQPDENKFMTGAKNIIKNLSGALALVTCREPLRVNMTNHIKKQIDQQSVPLNDEQKSKIINTTSIDNLNLGCALIKKAVIQKALQDIEKETNIIQAVKARKQARIEGKLYKDQNFLKLIQETIPIPPVLIPKGPMPAQYFKIYQDFGKKHKLNDQESSQTYLNKLLTNIFMNQQKFQNEPDALKQIIQQIQTVKSINVQEIKDFFLQKNYETDLVSPQGLAYVLVQFVTKNIVSLDVVYDIISALITNVKTRGCQFLLHKFILILNHQNPQTYVYQKLSDFISLLSRSRELVQGSAMQLFDQQPFKPRQSAQQEFHQLCQNKLKEWMSLTDSDISAFFGQLQKTIVVKNQQNLRKFFQILIDFCVKKALMSAGQNLDYSYVDSLSKLLILIILSLKVEVMSETQDIFQIICCSIQKVLKTHHQNAAPFNSRPFFRIFFNLIYSIRRSEYNFQESKKLVYFSVLAKAFDNLQPLKYPGFTFSWLALISNKYFIPQILAKPQYWDHYHVLLTNLFQFFRLKIVGEVMQMNEAASLYKGLLKTMVVLLRQYPDFLAEFSFQFESQIPACYIQLRNIILSAFSKNLQFPDSSNFTEFKYIYVENIWCLPKYYRKNFIKIVQEISRFDTIISNAIYKSQFKSLANFLELAFKNNSNVIHAFVVYLPYTQFDSALQISESNKLDQKSFNQIQARLAKLYIQLIELLSKPLKDALIQLIINEIKYPNLLTQFYILLIGKLLKEEASLQVETTIIRSITDRTKIQKPHPWGLIFVNNFFIKKLAVKI